MRIRNSVRCPHCRKNVNLVIHQGSKRDEEPRETVLLTEGQEKAIIVYDYNVINGF